MPQPPPVILLGSSPVTFHKIEDGIYAVHASACPKKFPGLNSAYELRCHIWEDEGFSDKANWLIFVPDYGWRVPSRSFGVNPGASLLKVLSLAEDIHCGKVGVIMAVTGGDRTARTNTQFDFSATGQFWTGASIEPHFYGAQVAALKGRKYKKSENSTNIKSDAMLDDLEASIGIGRHCAIEVLSQGRLIRGTFQSVYRYAYGFDIHLRHFYADGKTVSCQSGIFILNHRFKIAKRHLDGRWLEVLPK